MSKLNEWYYAWGERNVIRYPRVGHLCEDNEEEKAEGRKEKKKEVEQPQQQEEEDGVDDASLVKGAVQVFERRVSEFAHTYKCWESPTKSWK